MQVAFTEHINNVLGRDEFLRSRKYLPMDASKDDLWKAISDGVLLRCVSSMCCVDPCSLRGFSLGRAVLVVAWMRLLSFACLRALRVPNDCISGITVTKFTCSKLINAAQADTIDERALNFPAEGKTLNPWEMKENQNIVINSARSIGCQVVNIHASDLMRAAEEHKEHLVLGLIWQVVKVQLLSQISLKEVPELVRICGLACDDVYVCGVTK